jgi:hypothetical protein
LTEKGRDRKGSGRGDRKEEEGEDQEGAGR